MSDKLFRKKNMEKMASPEQLDDYIHVSSPSSWAVLAAFIILLVGMCIWGLFGRLDTTVSVVGVNENGGVVCYVKENEGRKIEKGMGVEINGGEFSVVAAEPNPILVDSSIPEYARYLGELREGEWVYRVHTDCGEGSEGQVFGAEIVIERVRPFYFVTN